MQLLQEMFLFFSEHEQKITLNQKILAVLWSKDLAMGIFFFNGHGTFPESLLGLGPFLFIITLPETNSSPLKIAVPNRKRESIPTIHFEGQTVPVSFRERNISTFLLEQ